ncbi:MAG: TetR/AcrR family transcriptional regulator C-terminal ligand-binding domain-containing protein [Cellvibrionaceae bacterium]
MTQVSEKNLRGRPRSDQARQAILKAFMASVKASGYSKLSIDQLSKQSGVSRSTIYRWYKEKVDIALDAASEIAQNARLTPLSGNREADLQQHFVHTFKTANTLGQLFTAMMAEAQANAEFSDRVWHQFSSLRRDHLRRVLIQGAEASRPTDDDLELIMDMVFGALWYRMMSGHAPLDSKFSAALIEKIDQLLKF